VDINEFSPTHTVMHGGKLYAVMVCGIGLEVYTEYQWTNPNEERPAAIRFVISDGGRWYVVWGEEGCEMVDGEIKELSDPVDYANALLKHYGMDGTFAIYGKGETGVEFSDSHGNQQLWHRPTFGFGRAHTFVKDELASQE
jgi:hypothetical protein